MIKDIPHRYMKELEGVTVPEHPALAGEKVCYVGQPVAVVVAEDPYLAKDALDLVRVSYQPLTPLIDPIHAADDTSTPVHAALGSNVIMRARVGRGDLEASFARADRIVRETYDVPSAIGGAHGRTRDAGFLRETGRPAYALGFDPDSL